MKVFHVADTHLGYSAYRKTTEEGINQRELDTYKAFEQFIDYSIKTKPDLIIHAGDLFDSVRPNNRAITFAIKQIIRLSEEKIPFILIAGNHEQPKLKETGHIFSIFDHIKHVYPVYNEKYEKINLEIKNKKITIHAIPQYTSKKEYSQDLSKIQSDKKSDYNILVTHGSVTGIKEFKMNEFNELIITKKDIGKKFDYVALGHYHRFTKVNENTYYSGSTEKYTFTDAKDKKGFIELTINDVKIKTKFIPLKTREMVDIKPIKCSKLKLDEIMSTIKKSVKETKPEEKTIRMTLEDIPSHLYRGIDFNEIRNLTKDGTHFEIKANIIQNENKNIQTSSKINALAQEFKIFLEKQNIKEKEKLTELGIAYIEKIEAKNEGK